MSFWTSESANPKRKFRFKVIISQGGGTWADGESSIWYAKTCTAPSVEISSVEHMFSDHVFNFPGRAKWGDVTMVMVDPSGEVGAGTKENVVESFNKMLERFGYSIPTDGTTTATGYNTIARNKIDYDVHIFALDDNGDSLEGWTLKNAFPIALKYGDFDYGADDLREMELTWKYDWAQCTIEADAARKYFQ